MNEYFFKQVLFWDHIQLHGWINKFSFQQHSLFQFSVVTLFATVQLFSKRHLVNVLNYIFTYEYFLITLPHFI